MTRPRPARALVLALAVAGCAAGPPPPPPRPPPSPPPADVVQARVALSGCLLASTEAEAASHPPPPVTRAPGPAATITAALGGVTVVHPLTHACCLTAAVATRLEGRTALVTERLSGTACRCRCGSTIRTELPLPAGAWTVAVELEDGGGTHRVAQADLIVR